MLSTLPFQDHIEAFSVQVNTIYLRKIIQILS
jgi:hypothetical protein